jgi:hypothetical protein
VALHFSDNLTLRNDQPTTSTQYRQHWYRPDLTWPDLTWPDLHNVEHNYGKLLCDYNYSIITGVQMLHYYSTQVLKKKARRAAK